MRLINRSAFIIRPKEPYLRWAAGIEDEPVSAVEDLGTHVSLYLVPEEPEGKGETPPVADYFAEIFAAELGAWCTDQDTWPKDRSLRTFLAWFEVIGESVIQDLGQGSIEHDDW